MKPVFIGLFTALFVSSVVLADEVQITAEIPFIEIEIGDETILIERIQDQDNRLEGDFTKTSRACPPFCIRPMEVAKGVITVGELEVLDFLETDVANKEGLLIDARIPSFYTKGTIPGSINIPFNILAPDDNKYIGAILAALGAVDNGDDTWNFANAKTLMLYCNGLWCGQSPRAINNLISMGYPAEKLVYYRGGMQAWQSVGLTVFVPNQ
ncbi:MAG: rhodanese-like domain-containing protein [Paracoccaceae bacterium]